jgi:hypothetical protein
MYKLGPATGYPGSLFRQCQRQAKASAKKAIASSARWWSQIMVINQGQNYTYLVGLCQGGFG